MFQTRPTDYILVVVSPQGARGQVVIAPGKAW
jgi:hypothetical protein